MPIDTNNDVDYFGDEADSDKMGCYAINVSVMHANTLLRKNPIAVALDSYANHTFGCTKQFSLNGVTGNAVSSRMDCLPCFGAAVITPESGCNAIALNDAEHYRVEYFQRDRYVVHVFKDLRLHFLHDESSKAYMHLH